MEKQQKYTLAIWVLGVVLLFHALFLGVSYYKFQLHPANGYQLYSVKSFVIYEMVVIAILVIEIIVYWNLRYRIVNRWWVRLHVWALFFAMVLAPFVTMAIMMILPNYFSATDYSLFLLPFSRIRFYIICGLLFIGHIFFIMTTVKSLQAKNTDPAKTEDDGILEEFAIKE